MTVNGLLQIGLFFADPGRARETAWLVYGTSVYEGRPCGLDRVIETCRAVGSIGLQAFGP